MRAGVVGREAELAAIDAFVEAVARGRGVLALEGEAGAGKTTLWRAALERAEAARFTVLSCVPAAGEAALSWAGLTDLLADVPDEVLAALPEPQRRALEVVLLRSAPEGTPPDARTVSVATLSVARSLASSSPVVVAVDDAQWLDPPTAAALEFAVRRLDRERVGILTAVRLGDGPVATFDRVAGDDRTAVAVGPLSVGALHELLKRRLGHSFLRPTLLRIEQASGGNPFYALEIARELLVVGEPPTGDRLPVPRDLRTLVAERLRRLPAATREALLVASTLSTPSVELVDEEALLPAEEADVARVDERGRVRFTHPLFASAVYSGASGAARRRVHRRLAGLVEGAEERARHLALATVEPDEDVAAALEEGAAAARAHGAWGSGARLLERARELTPPARREDALRRGVRAALHHLHEGDRVRAGTLLRELLADAPPGRLRADALRLLAEVAYNDGSYPEAARLFAEVLKHTEDPRHASTAELGLAFVTTMTWDLAAGAEHARRALDWAERAGDDALVAEALSGGTMIDFFAGRGPDWARAERAHALEDESRDIPMQARPSSMLALLPLFVGRFGEAREQLLAVRARAAERGEEQDLAFFLSWLVWLETATGSFAAAAALAEEAQLLATLTASGLTRAWVLAHRGLLRAHVGDLDGARADCAEATVRADEASAVAAIPWIVAGRCLAELAAGDAEAAWDAAATAVEVVEAVGVPEPGIAIFLPSALEAMVATGRLERAGTLLETFERRARRLDRVWALATGARCRGLLLAARGDLPGAEAALQEALVEHARLEMPFERARTLLCLGRVQRRGNERKQARAALGEALEVFETLGAPVWAEQARAEILRIGVRRAPSELTENERAVAELAATGLTNREIAARLFVSRRTVEANLARAYAKLGIRSRAELGARMAGGSN